MKAHKLLLMFGFGIEIAAVAQILTTDCEWHQLQKGLEERSLIQGIKFLQKFMCVVI